MKSKLWLLLITIILILVSGLIIILINQSTGKRVKLLEEEVKSLKQQLVNVNDNQNRKVENKNESVLVAIYNQDKSSASGKTGKNYLGYYTMIKFNVQLGEESQLFEIASNYYKKSLGYLDNKIFFISPSGELATKDLTTSEEAIIQIPEIKPASSYITEDTLADFTIAGNKLIYLKGLCSVREYCALGIYDLTNKTNQLIIDNLEKQVGGGPYGGIGIMSYETDRNILKVKFNSVDAGHEFLKIYEIDLTTKVIKQTESVIYKYCGPNNDQCTTKEQTENEKFNRLIRKDNIFCGKANIVVQGDSVAIKIGGYEKNFGYYSEYLSCFDS